MDDWGALVGSLVVLALGAVVILSVLVARGLQRLQDRWRLRGRS